MPKVSTILILLLLSSGRAAWGQQGPLARHAVIRFPSHGGSGTVIATGQGWSLILSCAHMLEGQARHRPMTVNCPSPLPGSPRRVGLSVLAVDHQADLSLIRLHAGPLPYVCPVAPSGHRMSRVLLSVGYDEMQLPPQQRPATVVGVDSLRIYTREKPWHGRSGGGLIDEQAGGYLVGVVQGYEVGPGGKGIYAGHQAVLAFLGRYQGGVQAPAPERGWTPLIDPPDLYWPRPPGGAQRMFPGRQCPT